MYINGISVRSVGSKALKSKVYLSINSVLLDCALLKVFLAPTNGYSQLNLSGFCKGAPPRDSLDANANGQ